MHAPRSPEDAARRAQVLGDQCLRVAHVLRSTPVLRYAWEIDGAPPVGPAPGPVLMALAVRVERIGIVTGVLKIPGDRWHADLFFKFWGGQRRAGSD